MKKSIIILLVLLIAVVVFFGLITAYKNWNEVHRLNQVSFLRFPSYY